MPVCDCECVVVLFPFIAATGQATSGRRWWAGCCWHIHSLTSIHCLALVAHTRSTLCGSFQLLLQLWITAIINCSVDLPLSLSLSLWLHHVRLVCVDCRRSTVSVCPLPPSVRLAMCGGEGTESAGVAVAAAAITSSPTQSCNRVDESLSCLHFRFCQVYVTTVGEDDLLCWWREGGQWIIWINGGRNGWMDG